MCCSEATRLSRTRVERRKSEAEAPPGTDLQIRLAEGRLKAEVK